MSVIELKTVNGKKVISVFDKPLLESNEFIMVFDSACNLVGSPSDFPGLSLPSY